MLQDGADSLSTWPPYGNFTYGNLSSQGRFSDGPVWPELAAKQLNLTLVNYAYGGATSNNDLVKGYTGPNSTIPVPGVYQQVATYLNSSAAANLSQSVFVLLVGVNDILFQPNLTAKAVSDQVLNATQLLVQRNASAIVLGAPYSLGETPYSTSSVCTNCTEQTSIDFDNYATNYLGNLTAASRALNNQTGIVLRTSVLDFYTPVQIVYGQPDAFGFNASTASSACLQGIYKEAPPVRCSPFAALSSQSTCSDVAGALWIDLYHGTTGLHQIFSSFATNAIANITGLASPSAPS